MIIPALLLKHVVCSHTAIRRRNTQTDFTYTFVPAVALGLPYQTFNHGDLILEDHGCIVLR